MKYQQESATGENMENIQVDSLFYGLYFGMTIDDFYTHSFEMNQKQIFFQNELNAELIIHLDQEFTSPVDFIFFPSDQYSTIQLIKGKMKYRKWSPFTKAYTGGKLLEEVKVLLEQWCEGNSFVKKPHPMGYWPYSYVKIDGNRKIQIYRSFGDDVVEIIFENLNKDPGN